MKLFILGLAASFLVSCSHTPPAPSEKPDVVLSGQEHEDFCERIEPLEKPNHGFSFEDLDVSGDHRISRQEFFCASVEYFNHLDTDHDGLLRIDSEIPPAARAWAKKVSTHRDGRVDMISSQDFLNIMDRDFTRLAAKNKDDSIGIVEFKKMPIWNEGAK
jgi:hypothetical protein